jgi:hypothetical protein
MVYSAPPVRFLTVRLVVLAVKTVSLAAGFAGLAYAGFGTANMVNINIAIIVKLKMRNVFMVSSKF